MALQEQALFLSLNEEPRQTFGSMVSGVPSEAIATTGPSKLGSFEKGPLTKVRWQCPKGHEWRATARQARLQWCPDCRVRQERI